MKNFFEVGNSCSLKFIAGISLERLFILDKFVSNYG